MAIFIGSSSNVQKITHANTRLPQPPPRLNGRAGYEEGESFSKEIFLSKPVPLHIKGGVRGRVFLFWVANTATK